MYLNRNIWFLFISRFCFLCYAKYLLCHLFPFAPAVIVNLYRINRTVWACLANKMDFWVRNQHTVRRYAWVECLRRFVLVLQRPWISHLWRINAKIEYYATNERKCVYVWPKKVHYQLTFESIAIWMCPLPIFQCLSFLARGSVDLQWQRVDKTWMPKRFSHLLSFWVGQISMLADIRRPFPEFLWHFAHLRVCHHSLELRLSRSIRVQLQQR